MAAVSLLGSTFTTTAGAKSVTASPAVGDLILICIQISEDVTWTAPTDSQGGTYTKITENNDADFVHAWYVRNSLVASATSTNFNLANPGSDTGGGLAVVKVTGMTKVGSAAVRQSKISTPTTYSSSSPPTTGTWTSAKLTTNPVIGSLFWISVNSHTITPTSGYTELLETGYSTPNARVEIQKIDSGDTTNTMVWGIAGSGSNTYFPIGVELDASASATSTGNFFQLF